jgi:hypothetical protein
VHGERKERGEEQHAKGRGGVDGPAQPDTHILHLRHRGLGPRTKEGLGQAGEERAKAGGRMGELELLSVSVARPGGVRRHYN